MRRVGNNNKPKSRPGAGIFPHGGGVIAGGRHRDSDASLCSSRPSLASSIGGAATDRGRSNSVLLPTDRASQLASLRIINGFLETLDCSTTLRTSQKAPIPSERDIDDAFRMILGRVGWQINNLKDDLPVILRGLFCPLKLSPSALKSPGTPHSWPQILWVLRWFTEIAGHLDDVSCSTPPPAEPPSSLPSYLYQSYFLFISGEDAKAAELDEEYKQMATRDSESMAAAVEALQKEVMDRENLLQSRSSEPSRLLEVEKEKSLLVEDVKKFETYVESFKPKLSEKERLLADLEQQLEVKLQESQRIVKENEELVKKIEGQAVGIREAEMMRRELQAVEMDIMEAEKDIIDLDEKASRLDTEARSMFKDIEMLAEECNQALRKLKLSNDFQYSPNAHGSSPEEVMGINYKDTIKPALNALSEETKKMSFTKLEEKITLQGKSSENTKSIEEKKEQLTSLHGKIHDDEILLAQLKKEMDYALSKFDIEIKNMKEEHANQEHELLLVEKDAEEFLQISEQILEEAKRETDERTQMCALELLQTIDAVSEYKEFMESTISSMRTDLFETTNTVTQAYKYPKRARPSPK